MATHQETLPQTAAQERKLAKEVNEEYHDPLDDWGARDILLSMVPLIVSIAFKDTALPAALAFGIAWYGALLLFRTISWDSKRKHIWPMVDIWGLITFAILRGVWSHHDYNLADYGIHKWWVTLISSIFFTWALLTLLFRRPFTAHYARYPKFDRGGRGVWQGDASYRRTNDMATLAWMGAFTVMCLLALIPNLTGNWNHWNALNIIFNYIIPFLCIAGALIIQQLLGAWYRTTASNALAVGTAGAQPEARGVQHPAGAEGQPGSYTYTSTAGPGAV